VTFAVFPTDEKVGEGVQREPLRRARTQWAMCGVCIGERSSLFVRADVLEHPDDVLLTEVRLEQVENTGRGEAVTRSLEVDMPRWKS
jgi:hypothetical protein